MAAWDWYPYDTYCQKLAGDWLWPNPAQNLANAGSTFNVKFSEAVYNAYRKGGFTFAEQFKDCVVERYGQNISEQVATGAYVSATQFAATVSLKMLAAVARAKADIAAEASVSNLQAALQLQQKQPGLQRGFMQQLLERPIGTQVEPLAPLPKPTTDEELYPASATLGDVVMNKNWAGYPYRGVVAGMEPYILAELDQMDVLGDTIMHVGADVPAKGLMWHGVGTQVLGGGNADDWANDQRAAGKGVLLGAGQQEMPSGTVTAVSPPDQIGGEGYILATRDISVVSALCQLDPTATVIYEPTSGWLEPSAAEAAQGKEAGVGLPDWAIYGGIAVGAVGVGWLVLRGMR